MIKILWYVFFLAVGLVLVYCIKQARAYFEESKFRSYVVRDIYNLSNRFYKIESEVETIPVGIGVIYEISRLKSHLNSIYKKLSFSKDNVDWDEIFAKTNRLSIAMNAFEMKVKHDIKFSDSGQNMTIDM